MVAGEESAEDFMIPKGCDQQGRHPEAAEAATEIGVDDAPETLGSIIVAGLLVVAIIGTLAFIAGYFS